MEFQSSYFSCVEYHRRTILEEINDVNNLSGWVGELFIRGSGSTFRTRSGPNRSTDEGEIKQKRNKTSNQIS